MLETMPNHKQGIDTFEVHRLDLPQMCPVSGNPQSGSCIRILYKPDGKLLEVYSLQTYVQSFVGGHPSGVATVPVKVYANLVLDCGQMYLKAEAKNGGNDNERKINTNNLHSRHSHRPADCAGSRLADDQAGG